MAAAAAAGLLAAGVQPVGKHCPGHGRATVDSHAALPELDAVAGGDLAPFARCAHLPWMMTAHIVYAGRGSGAPGHPVPRRRRRASSAAGSASRACWSATTWPWARCRGSPAERALAALAAGCDLALHCSGVAAETAALLHACPDATEAALNRMRAALFLAERSRQALDPSALLAEREALLA